MNPVGKRTRSAPLYTRLENAVDDQTRLVLVDAAKKYLVPWDAGHATNETKCFCLNACVKWDEKLEPEILPKVTNLLNRCDWKSLDFEVQKASLRLIKISGEQAVALGVNLIGKISLVAFELIRVPLQEDFSIPELEWHRDEGYLNRVAGAPFCYADSTTVFMLTKPTWSGGHIKIERNGVERGSKRSKNDTGKTEEIQYRFNEAVTFWNKNTRYSVTPIQTKNKTEDRIAFIMSLYGPEETRIFREHYCI